MLEEKDLKRFTPLEHATRKFQLDNYGPRYLGATLSKLEVDPWVSDKLIGWLKNPKNFLVYVGISGYGKTHFCSAITEWILQKFHTRRYYKEEQILTKLRSVIHDDKGDWGVELKLMMDDEIAIIDDIGSDIDPKRGIMKSIEWRSNVLFEILDIRYNSMLPTIFTSNLSEQQIREVFSNRACSRMFATENTIIDVSKGEDKRKRGL